MRLTVRNFMTVSVVALVIFGFVGLTIAKPPLRRHPRPRPVVVKKPVIVHVPAKPPRPAKSHLWVPRYKLHSGVVVGGHWRPPAKAGYHWKDGHWDNGNWIPGHWVPNKAKPKHVWVPGYWNASVWVDGYWRPQVKVGFSWLNGHLNAAGVWITGRWVSK